MIFWLNFTEDLIQVTVTELLSFIIEIILKYYRQIELTKFLQYAPYFSLFLDIILILSGIYLKDRRFYRLREVTMNTVIEILLQEDERWIFPGAKRGTKKRSSKRKKGGKKNKLNCRTIRRAWYEDTIKRTFYTQYRISINMKKTVTTAGPI